MTFRQLMNAKANPTKSSPLRILTPYLPTHYLDY
jgi:hypothetical protein